MDDIDLGATLKGFTPGQKLFHRYTLVRILGRGGMGVVWLARDEELEREVALKFLPEIVALDAEALADLKRETRRNLDLTHPHIVRIYDFVSDGRTAAISMEFVDGAPLSALKVNQPDRIFAVEELRPWVQQLTEALHYAHTRAKVVHRDLKPANLMISKAGELKITDFGIARGIADSVSRVSAQLAGSSGTPVYMSPQQMMGEKPAVGDDLYALGATLYELLTGKPPFHSGNIILQVQGKTPPSIAERRAELGVSAAPVPAEWEAAIAACLAKDPAQRPASAAELSERLGHSGKPTAAPSERDASRAPAAGAAAQRTDPPATEVKSPARKSTVPLLFAAFALLALGASGWYFGLHAPEQRRLAEIARLEAAGRAEEALRLKNEQERADALAKEQADREQRAYAVIRARIDSVLDGAPFSQVEAAETAVREYLSDAPERYAAEIRSAWTTRRAAWETARLAAARGGIVVRTDPAGAEVRVGAIALDKSPLTLREQRLGTYPVRVRLAGYEDWDGEVAVKENEFAELSLTLVRSTGRVVLEGTPGASVLEQGREIGVLPLSLDRVPTGAVAYTVRLPRHHDVSLKGEVVRGETLRLAATLERVLPDARRPFENTLGMKFVPHGTPTLLMAATETRVRDFRQFVRETGHRVAEGAPLYTLKSGTWADHQPLNWQQPGFAQTEDHPVTVVSAKDADAFCRWLTERELKSGDLRPGQRYRLPTGEEWVQANRTPEGEIPLYPWGSAWPPAVRTVNLAGTEARDAHWPATWETISGWSDGHARTAPVGSYRANARGIHELGGNVAEIIREPSGEYRLYGLGWTIANPKRLETRFSELLTTAASSAIGFRCVLDTGGTR